MKTIHNWLLALACVVFVIPFGCAGAPVRTPIADFTKRFECQGFSVRPPQGEGWYVGEQSPTSVIFTKGSIHTIIAKAGISGPVPVTVETRSDLLKEIARTAETDVSRSARHRPISIHVSLDKVLGWDCVKYEFIVEDRGAPAFPGSVLIMAGKSLYFLHPDSPK